jgi:hypothetical protein
MWTPGSPNIDVLLDRDASMQAAVAAGRCEEFRLAISSPTENRKVGGSTPPLATTDDLAIRPGSIARSATSAQVIDHLGWT